MEHEDPPRVRIDRREPRTPTGKFKRVIEHEDRIAFIGSPPLL